MVLAMNKYQIFVVLLLVVVLSILLGVAIQVRGFTSVTLVLVLSVFFSIVWLINRLRNAMLQPMQVMQALANGDTAYGFTAGHPMHEQLQNLADALQKSRQETAIQANYFKTLLQQLDVGVLVVNENGSITEQNIAAVRLLGDKLENIQAIPALQSRVNEMQRDGKHLVRQDILHWQTGERLDTFSVSLVKVEVLGQSVFIVTLQSIDLVLKARDQQAYKQLTHVLTHEVANSITPLASLSETALGMLPNELNFADQQSKTDLSLALNTIRNRTKHLDAFIRRFREVQNLPEPELKPVNVSVLLNHACDFMCTECESRDVIITKTISTDPLLMVDEGQIGQVLINLIKNALEAISSKHSKKDSVDHEQIILCVSQNNQGQCFVDVCDTGDDMPEQVVENCFVPFFSTKVQGSGIGLALARRVMLQHGGDLIYIPKNETSANATRLSGACFRIHF